MFIASARRTVALIHNIDAASSVVVVLIGAQQVGAKPFIRAAKETVVRGRSAHDLHNPGLKEPRR